MSGRSFEALHEAVEVFMKAETLDGGLAGVGRVLADEFDLWHSGVVLFGSGARMRIVSVWSAGPTGLEAGMELDATLTPAIDSYVREVSGGRTIWFRTDSADFGLFGDVLRAAGVSSGIVVPIHDEGGVRGFSAWASHRPDALGTEQVPFFNGLGRGIEERILELAQSQGLV